MGRAEGRDSWTLLTSLEPALRGSPALPAWPAVAPRGPHLWSSEKEVSAAPSPHVSEGRAGLFTIAKLSVQGGPHWPGRGLTDAAGSPVSAVGDGQQRQAVGGLEVCIDVGKVRKAVPHLISTSEDPQPGPRRGTDGALRPHYGSAAPRASPRE